MMTGRKGRSGRKPKPDALKDLHGSREPRNAKGPKPPEGKLSCPSWLDVNGRKKWRETYKLLQSVPGLVTSVDGDALAMYALAWQDLFEAQADVDAYGIWIETVTNGRKANPAVAAKRDAIGRIYTFIEQFGFSPRARTGINVDTPEDSDPFEAFLKRGLASGTSAN